MSETTKHAPVCADCHHTPSGRYANEYGARCYCQCHDVADAAPDLLAALQRHVDADHDQYDDLASTARAAIAKAKGEV